MMNEGDSCDEVPCNRRVLGDVTNYYGKRAFPSVTGKRVCGMDAQAGDEGAKFKTLVFGGVESSISKKGKTCSMPENYEDTVDGKGKGLSFSNAGPPGQYVIPGCGGGTSRENARPDATHLTKETKDLSTLLLLSSGAAGHRIGEADSSRRSCISFGSVPGQCDKSEDTSPESEEESQDDYETDSVYFMSHATRMEKRHDIPSASNESNMDFVVSKENKADSDDILTQLFDKPCSIRCSRPSGSFDCKMAGIEGLSKLHANLISASNNVEDSIDSGKACSCSFCLKAAYMWTDLHYQDTRGRLAALKKGRRHARLLEGKLYNHDQTAKLARDNSKKSTELEFDLIQRCRSLFLHTEDALVRETAQLHSTLLRLKDLRESCRRDLEMISMVSPDQM